MAGRLERMAGVLTSSIPLLLLLAWGLAWFAGHLPDANSGYGIDNHGPWRRLHVLRNLVWYAQWLPAPSLTLASAATVLRPTGHGPVLVGISILAWWGVLATHYWLVD